MSKRIILLRGVTPTGKNRVPMADLRRVLTDAGFTGVATYIQSGNVLLHSAEPADLLAKQINALIKEQIGADLKIVVKTKDELQSHLDQNPFPQDYEISRVFYTSTNQPLDPEVVEDLLAQDYGEDKLAVVGDYIYLYIPTDASRSKLNNNFLERRLKVDLTTRNFNTMRKLIELSDQ